MPEKDHLAKLRDSIDRHPRRWRRALNDAGFKGTFFPQIKDGASENKVVDAFADRNKEYSLKKRPQVRAYHIHTGALLHLLTKRFTGIRD